MSANETTEDGPFWNAYQHPVKQWRARERPSHEELARKFASGEEKPKKNPGDEFVFPLWR